MCVNPYRTPTQSEVDPPCHRKPQSEWCDSLGGGDFMGHTCEPAIAMPTAQERIRSIAGELGKVVSEKNQAYGSSFEKCDQFLRLLYPMGLALDQYSDALLLVRIFDKCMRIATRKDAFGESPYRDLAGYGILGAAKDDDAAEWKDAR